MFVLLVLWALMVLPFSYCATVSGLWYPKVPSSVAHPCVLVPAAHNPSSYTTGVYDYYCITRVGKEVYEFDEATSSWEVVSSYSSSREIGNEFQDINSFASVYDPHRHAIVVHGGVVMRDNVNVSVAYTFMFKIDSGVWTKEDLDGPEMYSHCIVLHGKSLFMVGNNNNLFALHHESTSWQEIEVEISGTVGESHTSFTCTKYKHFVYLFGGILNGEYTNDIFSWDLDTGKTGMVGTAGSSPAPRMNALSLVLPSYRPLGINNPVMLCYSGVAKYDDNTELFLNDVHILDLESFVWISITANLGHFVNSVPAILQSNKLSLLFVHTDNKDPWIYDLLEAAKVKRDAFDQSMNETHFGHSKRYSLTGAPIQNGFVQSNFDFSFTWKETSYWFTATPYKCGGRPVCKTLYNADPLDITSTVWLDWDKTLNYEFNFGYKSDPIWTVPGACWKRITEDNQYNPNYYSLAIFSVRCQIQPNGQTSVVCGRDIYGCERCTFRIGDRNLCKALRAQSCISTSDCQDNRICSTLSNLCQCKNDADCGKDFNFGLNKYCKPDPPTDDDRGWSWQYEDGGCQAAQYSLYRCESDTHCMSGKCVHHGLRSETDKKYCGVQNHNDCYDVGRPGYNPLTTQWDPPTSRCVAKWNEYCEKNSDCITGSLCVKNPGEVNRTCECSEDPNIPYPCKDGRTCVAGMCLLPAKSVCEDDWFCSSGNCVTEHNADHKTCGCVTGADCLSGECDNSTHICLLPIGNRCDDDSWCAGLQSCLPYPDRTQGCGCGYPVSVVPNIIYHDCNGSTATVEIWDGVVLPAAQVLVYRSSTDDLVFNETAVTAQNLTFDAIVGETYHISIVDSNGCAGTTDVFIPAPTVPQQLSAPELKFESISLSHLPSLAFKWDTNLTLEKQGYQRLINYEIFYRHYCPSADPSGVAWSNITILANESQWVFPAKFGVVYDSYITGTNCLGVADPSSQTTFKQDDPYVPSLNNDPQLLLVPTTGGQLTFSGQNLRLPLSVQLDGGHCNQDRMTESEIVCNVSAGWETLQQKSISAITNFFNDSDPENACTRQTVSAVWKYAPPTITHSIPLLSPFGGTYTITGTNFGPIGAPLTFSYNYQPLSCNITEEHVSVVCHFPSGSGTNDLTVTVGTQDATISHAYAECGVSCFAVPITMAPPTVLFGVADVDTMLISWYQLMHPSETGGIALDRYYVEYRTNCGTVPSAWTEIYVGPDVDSIALPYQFSTTYQVRVKAHGCCDSSYSDITTIESPDNPLMPVILAVLPVDGVPTSGGALLLRGANIPLREDDFSVHLFDEHGQYSCESVSIQSATNSSTMFSSPLTTVSCLLGRGMGSSNFASIVLSAPSCRVQQSANISWGYAAPSISGMTSLNTAGGSIIITGANFGNSAVSVMIDDEPCTGCSAMNDSSVSCANCPGGYESGHELQVLVANQLSLPFVFSYPVCTPVCVYGTCMKNDTGASTYCQCADGFTGVNCAEEIVCSLPQKSKCGVCDEGLCCHFVTSHY